MNDGLKIEYLPVGSLKPYEKNAKKHPAEQVEHKLGVLYAHDSQ